MVIDGFYGERPEQEEPPPAKDIVLSLDPELAEVLAKILKPEEPQSEPK